VGGFGHDLHVGRHNGNWSIFLILDLRLTVIKMACNAIFVFSGGSGRWRGGRGGGGRKREREKKEPQKIETKPSEWWMAASSVRFGRIGAAHVRTGGALANDLTVNNWKCTVQLFLAALEGGRIELKPNRLRKANQWKKWRDERRSNPQSLSLFIYLFMSESGWFILMVICWL